MGTFSRLLLTSGLVILTGPLCLLVQAQSGYVDVEAERAAARAAGKDTSSTAADPYGAPQPAQAYPATSYGVTTAPAATPVTTAAARQGGTGTASSSLGNLVLQVQQLQQEIMRLNGKVEEQAHALRMLKEQSKQRYMDIDRRLNGGAGASGESVSASASDTGGTPVASSPSGSRGASAAEQPGEVEAYRAAYALVQGKQFNQAIPAFQQFLRSYPDGRYTPNAQYWLGELYLVQDPPDLEAARQAFALLVSEYPDHPKTPDALFKLGKVQFMKGNREKAREYLDLVIRQYGSSNSSAVKLAREFIAENY